MKYFYRILLISLMMLTVLYCGDSGGGAIDIPGAPDLSPEEIESIVEHFEEALSGDVPVQVEDSPAEEPKGEEPPAEEPKGEDPLPEEEKQPAKEEKQIAKKKKQPAAIGVSAEIAEGKWSTAPGKEQDGIYTLWEKQVINLSVSGVPNSGWYELGVEAKNIYGPLPEWYRFFTINVSNESAGTELGGLFVPASDAVFKEGTMRIFLEEGTTELQLVWAGDAYSEGEYDTNILIGKIGVKFLGDETVPEETVAKTGDDDEEDDTDVEEDDADIEEDDNRKGKGQNREIIRLAKEYSALEGRWFFDNKSGWTHGASQYIGFNFKNLEPGKYRVTIMAMNNGKLPKGYNHFKVEVSADGVDGIAKIPAHDRVYHRGSVILDLTGGNTDLFLNWLNDEYDEGRYDTNIRIKQVALKRIGRSERSALAAYLLGTSQGNRLLIFGTLITLIMLIGALFILNKRRAHIGA